MEILSLGNQVKVLEPESLRKTLKTIEHCEKWHLKIPIFEL
jgi:predicted DNA-binding transcriptional regulator YafY